MEDKLRKLWELQKVDIEIRELEEKEKKIPKEIEKMKVKVKEKEKIVNENKRKHNSLVMRRRRLEQDIEEAKDKAKKYKSQLLQVKTNKEYQALLHEINTQEAKISAFEEESLELLGEVERLGEKVREEEKRLKEEGEKFRKFEEEKVKELEKIKELLNQRRKNREFIAKNINSLLLAKYNQVRRGLNGVGVVEMLNSICTGCNAVIPPQFAIEIKKGDRLISCEVCGRILVWRENVE